MTVTLRKTTKISFKQIEKNFREMGRQRVLIGIPKSMAARSTGESNAAIGYIQEKGAPKANIPPRPFLIPGVKKVELVCAALLKEASPIALQDEALVGATLNKVGLRAVVSVVDMFTNNSWPALSKATIRARLRKMAPGNAKKFSEGHGALRPLIDTGQLRRSITYIVRREG